MLQTIASRFSTSLKGVPNVGDSLRDLQAGVAVGCRPHLVRTGKVAHMSQAQIDALCAQVPGTVVHADLTAFAEYIILEERKGRGESGESDSGYGKLG